MNPPLLERFSGSQERSSGSVLLYLSFALSIFTLHIMNAQRYGYQRDELYFVACARHLAWGYADQPPVIAVIAKAALVFFGQSLFGLHFFPALAAALIVVITGQTAHRLGGGLIAQGFAMLAVSVAPYYLAVGSLLTMNAFEPLLWTAAACKLIDILNGKQRIQDWTFLSVAIALGILTKYTMGLFTLSLFAALLFLPERRLMSRAGFWFAFALTAMLIAPNIWWQYVHGWPQFVVLHDAMYHKNIDLGPVAFGAQQILMVNPLTLPLWAGGLLFFLLSHNGRYRVFFLSYALLFVADVLLRAKIYYLAPIYPLLFAAGSCAMQARLAASMKRRAAYAGALLIVGVILLPQVVPVLPFQAFLAYQRVLDVRQLKGFKHETGVLPERYADTVGWEQLVAAAASAYYALPPPQRARTAIWAGNYGEAAAIDLLGEKYALPKAISGHNAYYLWGPRDYDGSSVIAVGVPASLTRMEFNDVRREALFTDPYVLPEQNNVPIVLCTRPREPLAAFWPHAKAYW